MLIAELVSLIRRTFSEAATFLTLKQGLRKIHGVSLYRNAVYIILSGGALNLTGFLFWLLAARLYSTEDVGVASAAISAISLLTLVATLGLDYALIRYLPGAGDKARGMINSSLTLTGLISIALALVFLAGLTLWSPALLFIRQNPVYSMIFIATTVFTTLRTLSERILIGKRRANLSLTQGLVFSLLRFAPLVVLAGFFQSFGIFTSWGIAVTLATVLSIIFLLPRVETGYRPFPVIRKSIIAGMIRFSLSNQIAAIFWAATPYILPLVVINLLGAESTAYFYIAWAVGSVLFMIPVATSFSLFAEGSHNEERLGHDIMRSLKLILVILIPAIAAVLLLGDKILLIFGRDYAENATGLLRMLAISSLPLSINFLYFSKKRVELAMRSVVGLTFLTAFVTMALSYVLLPRIGLIGVGIGWLAAQSITAVISANRLWFARKGNVRAPERSN